MLTKREFNQKLRKARKLTEQANELKGELLNDYLHLLEDVPFQAENSENLSHALQCFIDYGELPISGNISDFYDAYAKALADNTN